MNLRLELLALKAKQLLIASDAKDNTDKWITTETGSHVLVGEDGTIKGGAGGKFNGKPLSSMGGTKKFTQYETVAERETKNTPQPKHKTISNRLNDANKRVSDAKTKYLDIESQLTAAKTAQERDNLISKVTDAHKELNSAKNNAEILEKANRLKDLKVINVAGMGNVLTENGKEPFKVISGDTAKKIMEELGITGTLQVRGNSKFIKPEDSEHLDKSLVSAKKEATAKQKEQPLHEKISKLDNGRYAVSIPYELKDKFKTAFSSAEFDKNTKQWTVGKLSSAKLNEWVNNNLSSMSAIETKKAESKQSFENKLKNSSSLSGNTYHIKDELKDKFGAFWHNNAWHVPKEKQQEAQEFINSANKKETAPKTSTSTTKTTDPKQGRYTWNTSPEEAARLGIDWFDLPG